MLLVVEAYLVFVRLSNYHASVAQIGAFYRVAWSAAGVLVINAATAGLASPEGTNGEQALGAGVALPLTGSPLFNVLGLAVGLGIGVGAWLSSQYVAALVFAVGVVAAAGVTYRFASGLRRVLVRRSGVVSAISVACTLFGFALLVMVGTVHQVGDISLHRLGVRLYEIGGAAVGVALLGLWKPRESDGKELVSGQSSEHAIKGVSLRLRRLLVKGLPVSAAYVVVPLLGMEGARFLRLLLEACIVVLLGAFGIVSGAVVVFLLLVVVAWGFGYEMCCLGATDLGGHSLFSTLSLDGGKQQRRALTLTSLFAVLVVLGASALDSFVLGVPHLLMLSVAPAVGGTASVVAGAFVVHTLRSHRQDIVSTKAKRRKLTLPLVMALYAVIPLLSLIQMHDAYVSGGDLLVPAVSASTFSLVFPLAAASWLARKAY